MEDAPGPRGIRIVVERGESIRGVVLDATGQPASQVIVTAMDKDGNAVAHDWVWDRPDGSFELRGLRPGVYDLKAHGNDDRESPEFHARLTAVAAGSTGIRLQLPK